MLCGRASRAQNMKRINNLYLVIVLIVCFTNTNSFTEERNNQLNMLKIGFPLQGVYITPNTPGSKVPSHGTSNFGEEHAIDFVMINATDFLKKPYKKSFFEYVFNGVQLIDFYGWGQKVYSPLDGEIVGVENGIEERNPVNIINDYKNTVQVTKQYLKDQREPTLITGNYVMIKHSDSVYVLLAHLKYNSVKVKIGQHIQEHEEIGELGHSGNSTMPHLHMQLMNNKDYSIAKGLPFLFKKYELKKGKKWIIVSDSIPKKEDVIRNIIE